MAQPMIASYLRGKGPKPAQSIIVWKAGGGAELRRRAQIEEVAARGIGRNKSIEIRTQKRLHEERQAAMQKNQLKLRKRRRKPLQ